MLNLITLIVGVVLGNLLALCLIGIMMLNGKFVTWYINRYMKVISKLIESDQINKW